MKRFDLRYLKNDFYDKMLELMDKQISSEETAIIMFEIGDFNNIQKSADVIYEAGYTLMNSIKFNEVDWTLVVKKQKPEPKAVEEIAQGKTDE
ncbi:MAG: NADH-ubiquinone oxidoreductase subunit E family protein [Aliarcobacter sp.]|jgi:NADH-quinone oxidoreductase subunit E|nr:NADH-ubiquinone oxidoreductase subunit E family protein [Aliarcobacter sp.]